MFGRDDIHRRMGGMYRMRGGLRYFVMYLLKEKPMNGAEIMNAMESNSMGFWRPSPGSVYPLLENLASEKLIKKRDDGRYELTVEGKESTDFGGFFGINRPRTIDEMISEMNSYISYMEDLKTSDPDRMNSYSNNLKLLSEKLKKVSEPI
ncbi:MAG: PadR family transcriptional regulator [Thermoplasmataceae archaeon]